MPRARFTSCRLVQSMRFNQTSTPKQASSCVLPHEFHELITSRHGTLQVSNLSQELRVRAASVPHISSPGLGCPLSSWGVIHRSQAYAKDSDQLQAPFLRFELGSQIFHTNKCALTSVMDKRCIPFLFSFSFLPSRGRSWRGQIVTCDQFSEPVPNILIHSLYTDHRVGNKRFHILHSTFNAF